VSKRGNFLFDGVLQCCLHAASQCLRQQLVLPTQEGRTLLSQGKVTRRRSNQTVRERCSTLVTCVGVARTHLDRAHIHVYIRT
jgi:hypothetical protein